MKHSKLPKDSLDPKNAFFELPAGYSESVRIEKKDKKAKRTGFITVVLMLLIAAALTAIGHLIVPIQTFYMDTDTLPSTYIPKIVLIVMTLLYLFAFQKPVHLLSLHICGAAAPYCRRNVFVFCALLPVLLWEILIVPLLIILPVEWFWPLWIFQLLHLSFSVNDLCVAAWTLKSSPEAIVRSSADLMIIYERNKDDGNVVQ